MIRLLAVLVALAVPAQAFAWAETGHRILTPLAVEALPPELPAFLKSPTSLWQLGELAREPDRSRNSGQPHAADLEPNHFIDVDDAGLILGGPPLTALPANRAQYEKALQAAGTDSVKAGALPYALMDGWQQLVKDFAYWRVLSIGERTAPTPDQRAWFAADKRLREQLILRDLGYWSHFVGDAAQPMHVSVHYSGWGAEFPNPKGYTNERIHAAFEGAYVRANVSVEAVRSAMKPPSPCDCTIQARTLRYIQEGVAQVEPLYALWTEGGFKPGDPRGVAFTVDRLAAGASELRDLITDAWQASAGANVGYPIMQVRDLEASQSVPIERLYGLE